MTLYHMYISRVCVCVCVCVCVLNLSGLTTELHIAPHCDDVRMHISARGIAHEIALMESKL